MKLDSIGIEPGFRIFLNSTLVITMDSQDLEHSRLVFLNFGLEHFCAQSLMPNLHPRESDFNWFRLCARQKNLC